jgi:hypothetical protein
MWWTWWLGGGSAASAVEPPRGPALSLSPGELAAGVRTPVGQALHLDLRAGPSIGWQRTHATDTAPLRVVHGSGALVLGLGGVVAARAPLGSGGPLTGWWTLDLGGKGCTRRVQLDATRAQSTEGRDRWFELRAGTGPGLEGAVSPRWTFGVDLSVGIARYEQGRYVAADARSGVVFHTDARTVELGWPVDLGVRFLLHRYPAPR